MDGAKFVMTVYDAAFGLEAEDSYDGLSYVSDACKKALNEILNLADVEQERRIYSLFGDFLENNDWCCGSDDLEKMILSLNWSAEVQQKNLEWLDENLDSCRMSQRAKLMERMGASASEIIAWWEQYLHSNSSYEPLLKLYEDHDPAKAIELVQEKRKQECNRWRVIEYTKTLLSLLEKAGQSDQYFAELRYLLMDLKCHEIQYVSAFKLAVPVEQWTSIFETLLADEESSSVRMSLYHFEGMYSQLFSELSQSPNLSDFIKYEDSLRKWDPDQTLTLYVRILKQEMDHACDRKQYHHIIRHLQWLTPYPRGTETAQELAQYWYVYHKNRPAMKDELLQAGYSQK